MQTLIKKKMSTWRVEKNKKAEKKSNKIKQAEVQVYRLSERK